MGEVTLGDVLETMKRDAGSAWRCRVANQHEQTPEERHEFSARSREARAFVEQQAAALQSEKARADAADAEVRALRDALKRHQDGRVFHNLHTRQVARSIEQEAATAIQSAEAGKGEAGSA